MIAPGCRPITRTVPGGKQLRPPDPVLDQSLRFGMRPGDSARWGPSLVGVLGRTMGAEPGYRYGSYLRGRRDAAATWDDAAFRRWVVGSKAVARDAGARTKMPAQELSEADLDALIAFLRTVK